MSTTPALDQNGFENNVYEGDGIDLDGGARRIILDFLQEKGLVHKDIKSAEEFNFLDDGTLTYQGFGGDLEVHIAPGVEPPRYFVSTEETRAAIASSLTVDQQDEIKSALGITNEPNWAEAIKDLDVISYIAENIDLPGFSVTPMGKDDGVSLLWPEVTKAPSKGGDGDADGLQEANGPDNPGEVNSGTYGSFSKDSTNYIVDPDNPTQVIGTLDFVTAEGSGNTNKWVFTSIDGNMSTISNINTEEGWFTLAGETYANTTDEALIANYKLDTTLNAGINSAPDTFDINSIDKTNLIYTGDPQNPVGYAYKTDTGEWKMALYGADGNKTTDASITGLDDTGDGTGATYTYDTGDGNEITTIANPSNMSSTVSTAIEQFGMNTTGFTGVENGLSLTGSEDGNPPAATLYFNATLGMWLAQTTDGRQLTITSANSESETGEIVATDNAGNSYTYSNVNSDIEAAKEITPVTAPVNDIEAALIRLLGDLNQGRLKGYTEFLARVDGNGGTISLEDIRAVRLLDKNKDSAADHSDEAFFMEDFNNTLGFLQQCDEKALDDAWMAITGQDSPDTEHNLGSLYTAARQYALSRGTPDWQVRSALHDIVNQGDNGLMKNDHIKDEDFEALKFILSFKFQLPVDSLSAAQLYQFADSQIGEGSMLFYYNENGEIALSDEAKVYYAQWGSSPDTATTQEPEEEAA